MSARARVYAVVAAVALTAAVAVAAITALTADHPPAPRPGSPPYADDWTAPRRLARDVRAAMDAWPHGTVGRLASLARARPASGLVHLNLGLALYWRRSDDDAFREWRTAKRVDPDTPSALRAQDLLHPNSPHGLPPFQPTFTRATNAAQRHLVRGVRLQRSGRPLSAEREFAAAARLAPGDPDAQVAAAVGLFDKDRPAPAFARLGPLARRFPRAQTVRFHLGLLAIWISDFADARKELRQAVALGPKTSFAREARTLLKRLEDVGTR